MKNAELIKKRLEEIKKMENSQSALCALADIQYEIGISSCDEREELRCQIQELRKILIGNGDPQNSVLARLNNVERKMDNINENTIAIKVLLQGDIKDSNSIGILDRVRKNEEGRANINKVLWIVISVTLAEFIASILGLL